MLKNDPTPLVIGGDGMADSPGHSAKYGSYSVFELNHKIVLDILLVQGVHNVTAKSLKKRGASEMLKEAKEYGICNIKRGKTMKPVKMLKKEQQSTIKVLSIFDTTDFMKAVDTGNPAAVTAELL
uniref:Uncharacterized protein n=1 Tax=Amphimedon queenslandica TaxID=400682 RepID=A0A1X7VYI6_AMPQE